MLEELHAIRKRGFSPGAIEAATNSIEFMLRENNTGRFPRGLSMMLRAMGLWIYNLDPFTCAPPPVPSHPSCTPSARAAVTSTVFADVSAGLCGGRSRWSI